MRATRALRATAPRTVLLACVLALASLAFSSDDGDCGPEDLEQIGQTCEVTTWFACPGTPVHTNTLDGDATLTGDAPEASIQDGAGCGHLSEPFTSQIPTDEDLRVSGQFTGNLATVGVELHLLGPGYGTAELIGVEALFDVPWTLTIDGVTTSGTARALSPELSDTGASMSVAFDLPVTGLADEPGFGTSTRDVTVEFGYPSIDACDVYTGQDLGCFVAGVHAYAWGTTEAPAGVTFNGSR